MISVQSASTLKLPVSTLLNQTVGKSFADYLGEASYYDEPIPDDWCSDTDKFGTGVDKAVKYMKEVLGISFDNRTPAYEITDEQMQWLKSRHDLDGIYKTECGGCECGTSAWTMSWWDENFLSDLVYLNVISPEDAKSFGWIAFPGTESGTVYAASDGDIAGSGRLSVTDIAAKVLQKQQAHIDSIYEKYENDLSLMLKQDKEFLETAQKLLEKNRIWYDLLQRLSENQY